MSASTPANAHRIGDDARLEGQISFEGPVRVDGEIVGEVSSSELVIIGPSGRIEGKVTGASVEVQGLVRGEVVATERAAIRARGRVFGELRTPRLSIEDGAVFEGTCAMDGAEPPPASAGDGSG